MRKTSFPSTGWSGNFYKVLVFYKTATQTKRHYSLWYHTLSPVLFRLHLLASLSPPPRAHFQNNEYHRNGKYDKCTSYRVCPSRTYIIGDDIDERDGDGTEKATDEVILLPVRVSALER